MSAHGVKVIRAACKQLIADGMETTVQKRLRGSLAIRAAATAQASDIYILAQMNSGREWSGDHRFDKLLPTLRDEASNIRQSADARIVAIKRMCAIEGILGHEKLGDGILDDYIRQLLGVQVQSPATLPSVETPQTNEPTTMTAEDEEMLRQFNSSRAPVEPVVYTPAPTPANVSPASVTPEFEDEFIE